MQRDRIDSARCVQKAGADICGCIVCLQVRTWTELPAAARAYVERCEQLLGTKVEWIGVGPGRDAIVTKP